MTAFYIKGTDNKIRTSKTHTYTHAVYDSHGALLGCCGSLELAHKTIDREASFYWPRSNGEDILSSGILYVCARNISEARKDLDEHDGLLGQEKGRKFVSYAVRRGLRYHGVNATEKELENARKVVSDRQAWVEGCVIVELEAREK